jgi:CRISPR system Cascade subunit CasE
VFLDRCWQQEDAAVPVDREAAYRDWLAAELARNHAATLAAGRLEGFQIGRLLRRTQGTERRSAIVERPDALMGGELVVDDGPAFGQLLQRGLGRHRAFGFGMLLLRHPERL